MRESTSFAAIARIPPTLPSPTISAAMAMPVGSVTDLSWCTNIARCTALDDAKESLKDSRLGTHTHLTSLMYVTEKSVIFCKNVKIKQDCYLYLYVFISYHIIVPNTSAQDMDWRDETHNSPCPNYDPLQRSAATFWLVQGFLWSVQAAMLKRPHNKWSWDVMSHETKNQTHPLDISKLCRWHLQSPCFVVRTCITACTFWSVASVSCWSLGSNIVPWKL